MNEPYQPPKRTWPKKFADAGRGAWIALSGGGSYTIHIFVSAMVIAAAVFFGVTAVEWCLLLLCIALVFTAEIHNTGLEILAKAIRQEYDANIRDALDATLGSLAGRFVYPFTYGYAASGVVEAVGADVDPAWMGRRVFAFHPHASAFTARAADLVQIPDDVTLEQAVFLPTAETALGIVHDLEPRLGERGVVATTGGPDELFIESRAGVAHRRRVIGQQRQRQGEDGGHFALIACF